VIRANNEIDVLVPPRMPGKYIEQFVLSKSKWIDKKLHFNEQIRLQHQPKKFIEGEIFHFLGTPCRLNVTHEEKESILLNNNDLYIYIKAGLSEEKQTQHIQKKLLSWYKEQAEFQLHDRAEHFSTMIGKAPSHVGIKNYKSRWGSCHHDGQIYLNWRLIMAPEWVFDYVVIHELCHLIHHNHSPAFWQLVETIVSDYRNAKTWLKINGLTLEL
jgi:predicted metal-dependent hydrolase